MTYGGVNVEQNVEDLLNDIDTELSVLSNKMKDIRGNEPAIPDKLIKRINFIKWVNMKWKLRENKGPNVVKQKEIFYCELGENIGSEQNLKRPVVIIQNDIGNSKGSTTLIVPITTYQNSNFYEEFGKRYVSYNINGDNTIRELDFYEIQVEIKPQSKYPIHGIANVVQLRAVSKKRLSNTPVANITDETYNKIVEAIIKNISEFK